MSWQRQGEQQQPPQQQGEVVLLLASCLFAPFTLLTCLTLYKLARCRKNKKDGDGAEEAKLHRHRWAAIRQVVMLAWLTAMAAFAAAGASYLAMRDFHLQDVAPGDQRLIRLGSWAGVCSAVSISTSRSVEIDSNLAPVQAEIVNPGLIRERWKTEQVNRRVSGRMRTGRDASSGEQQVEAAWELPVGGRRGRRAPANLRVAANFRHRLQLRLWRRSQDEEAGGGDEEKDAPESLGYGDHQLVDEVQGINSVTVYNVSQSGRLALRLTNLDDGAAAEAPEGANFSYSFALSALRYATGADSVGQSQRIDCRLGQAAACLVENPPAWLILQLLAPTDPSPPTVTQNRRHPVIVRCERALSIAKAAPAVLAAVACLPCAVVLVANALLASQCDWVLCRTTGRLETGQSGQQRRSSLSTAVPGKGGRRIGRLGVRFQLQDMQADKT